MHTTAPHVVELAQARQRAIEDRDVGAEANRHVSRVRAGDTAADHEDVSGRHAGDAAEQLAAAAVGFLQSECAGLDRQATRNFGHRREQRQRSIGRRDGFVGDRGGAGLYERFRLRRVGGKV